MANNAMKTIAVRTATALKEGKIPSAGWLAYGVLPVGFLADTNDVCGISRRASVDDGLCEGLRRFLGRL